jgi:uncharacterized protein YbaP (TraB family)
MELILYKGFLIFTVYLFSLTANAASVWKVSHDDQHLYLAGTLHVLSPEDYPLPREYEVAYQDACTLIFETDINALTSPEFQQQSLGKLTYLNGQTLADDLSPDTLDLLSNHLQSRGVDMQTMMLFKPSLVSVTLSMIELNNLGLTSQGVDKFYFERGQLEQKSINWFETPEQQLEFIANMGEGDNDAMIRYSIDDLKTINTTMAQLKDDWLQGDMAALYEHSMRSFATDYPAIYQELLVNRNLNWLPALNAMMDTPDTEMVLVGTMHLAGEQGLIQLLRKAGYRVEKVKA